MFNDGMMDVGERATYFGGGLLLLLLQVRKFAKVTRPPRRTHRKPVSVRSGIFTFGSELERIFRAGVYLMCDGVVALLLSHEYARLRLKLYTICNRLAGRVMKKIPKQQYTRTECLYVVWLHAPSSGHKHKKYEQGTHARARSRL